jgi:hypothetical protein
MHGSGALCATAALLLARQVKAACAPPNPWSKQDSALLAAWLCFHIL